MATSGTAGQGWHGSLGEMSPSSPVDLVRARSLQHGQDVPVRASRMFSSPFSRDDAILADEARPIRREGDALAPCSGICVRTAWSAMSTRTESTTNGSSVHSAHRHDRLALDHRERLAERTKPWHVST